MHVAKIKTIKMYKNQKKRTPICFKRWKRAPWAAFASMGKLIKIGVLSVSCSILVMRSQPLLAQGSTKSDNDTIRALEELVINTERPTPFQPLVRIVSVIQRSEIEQAAVKNLPDLLRHFSGIDLRSRGSEGVQADLNILGGTFDQSMVMINGINYTDPQTGHYSLDIPIELSQIERIEVLQGPGAINIITRNPSSREISASLSGGSHGYFKGNGNIGFSGGALSGQIGGGYSQSDGYSENTDFNISNLFSNITLNVHPGHLLTFTGGYQHKEYGANSFYSVAYPEQFEETRTFLSSLQYLFESKGWQVRGSIYQRRHYDRFELFRYDAASWYNGHNYHQNDIYGFSAEAARRWSTSSTTMIGAGYRVEHIYSTVLGDPLENGKRVPFEDDIEYTRSKQRDIPSIYIKQTEVIGKWRLNAGLTLERPGELTHLCYGVSGSYSISPYLEANAWINNSFRNPTFTDLYYKSPTQTGNMNLKPEEMITGRIGIKYTKRNLSSSIYAFYRRGLRMIDWTRESGSDQWSASNITNVNSTGAEYSLRYIMNYGPFKSFSFLYAYLDVAKNSPGMHSLYATDFLRHKAALTIDHKIAGKLGASWVFSYQKREGTYLGADNTEIPYKGFMLADLKLSWNSKRYNISMDVTNLFDKEYLYIGNLPQPGRWIKCGVEVRL